MIRLGAEKVIGNMFDFLSMEFGFIYFNGKTAKAIFQKNDISKEFKYVHELQNYIYSSTGEEVFLNTEL